MERVEQNSDVGLEPAELNPADPFLQPHMPEVSLQIHFPRGNKGQLSIPHADSLSIDADVGSSREIASRDNIPPCVELWARSSRTSDDPRTPITVFGAGCDGGHHGAGLPPQYQIMYCGLSHRYTVQNLKGGCRFAFVLRAHNALGPSECSEHV